MSRSTLPSIACLVGQSIEAPIIVDRQKVTTLIDLGPGLQCELQVL